MRFLPKPAYTLFVKTGPACNAGCISCPSGRKMPGDIEKVPLMKEAMFERIISKVLEQANISGVVLHYYNEPTMNPHMPAVIKVASSRGIASMMSTNGSYPDILHKCMAANLTNLIISVSGWTQSIHERSHKHTDIELIKKSMIEIRKNLKSFQHVRVGWHDYAYNEHEKPLMAAFCKELGFKFTPYYTSVLPLEIPLQIFDQVAHGIIPTTHVAERDIRMPLKHAAKLCMARKHFTCVYQQRMITVDGNGMIYNCAAKVIPSNVRCSIFDVSLESFQKARFSDSDCVKCKSIGGHVYGTQKYDASLSFSAAVMRKAEDIYRRAGISAMFPKLSAKIMGLVYERPGKRKALA